MFNKAGIVYRKVICKDVFLMKPISEMSLNYTSQGIYTIIMQWAVDVWEDIWL
jgi:hypothetical protein